MFWRRTGKILAAALIVCGAFIGSQAVVSVAGNSGRGEPRQAAPKRPEEIRRIVDENARKGRFNGTVHGWRLAPYDVLKAEGRADRNLFRACDPRPAGEETKTELDFVLSYLPAGITIENATGPSKWVCNGKGLSVMYDLNITTPYGVGNIWAERAIWGRPSLDVFVANDRVEAGWIKGLPAIFVHPADDPSGIGQSHVIVIEDNTAPEFTILRLSTGDGVSFPELIKIVEGVK